MRRRDLSEDEEALWKSVARSIKPLQPRKPEIGKTGAVLSQGARAKEKPQPLAGAARAAPDANPPPLAPFERRLRQRVARGREPIEARVDLHGMTQNEAHAALGRFLRGAQAHGAKIVLIVTGKGSRGAGGDRGVLRRQVPLWLALPEFRPLVVGFEDAHAAHGGQGALYVRLRRPR